MKNLKKPYVAAETADGRFQIVDQNGTPVPGKDGQVPQLRFLDIAEMIAGAMNAKGQS